MDAPVTRAARPERPSTLPGFEQLQRFWEPDTSRWTVKLLPGEYYVTRGDEAITTVLGSCVAACIRDSQVQVGGMNHFMLPEDGSFHDDDSVSALERQSTRYGSYAMESLINDLLKLGAARERLEIKLFGGGRILASMTDIGARNISFIKRYLRTEGLGVSAHNLGGDRPRKVVYFPMTGLARMKTLRPIENRSIADREQLYLARLRRDQDGGDIEIFYMNAAPIRVLVVDDSALVRSILCDVLNADPAIEVVGTAGDAHIAREKIKRLNPDVLTLDVEMPRMDGLTFLSNLMRLHPMPVVMVSSLTERGADITFDALAMGAVDYLPKPRIDIAATLQDYGDELIAKIKTAARANVRALDSRRMRTLRTREAVVATTGEVPQPRRMRTTDRIIAIGASTGGTEAIKEVLCHLPPDCPGVLVTQHIPPAFSASFARRMNDVSPLTVCEAKDGQQVLAGHVYIAPGDYHLSLARDGTRYVCKVNQEAPVNRHRPSVDVLFRSVAKNAGQNAIGVLLTGMGRDGARGLKTMREAGAATMAQDEHTSVVWGMPGEAVALGATETVLPIEEIAPRIAATAAAMEVERPSSASG